MYQIHYDDVHSFQSEGVITLVFDHKLSSYFKNTHPVTILRYLSMQLGFVITQICIIAWFPLLHTVAILYIFAHNLMLSCLKQQPDFMSYTADIHIWFE